MSGRKNISRRIRTDSFAKDRPGDQKDCSEEDEGEIPGEGGEIIIKRPILWITGAVVLGEVTAYWFAERAERIAGAAEKALLFFIFILALAGIAQVFQSRAGERRAFLFLAFSFLAGGGRMAWGSRPLPCEAALESGGNSGVLLEGRLRESKVKNGYAAVILEEVRLRPESGPEYRLPFVMASVKGELWTEQGAVPGMRVGLEGEAGLFEPPRNPGEFDYPLYYRSKNLRVRVKAARVWIADPGYPPLEGCVKLVRDAVTSVLSELCTPEDAAVYQAVLLGDQSRLPEEVRTLYQKNGIAHLLAVSGLHVSLMGAGLYGLCRRAGLGYGGSGLLAGLALFFYGALTGFGPSVFRAVAMLACSFLASYLGRTYDLLSALALSLLILAFDSPYLIFAGGVQLSFAAVAAIGWGSGLWKRRRADAAGSAGDAAARGKNGADSNIRPAVRLTAWTGKLAEPLWMSFCIEVVTFPIILYHFFEFPPYGLVLNLFVIPLMAYVVGSGLSAVSFGLLSGRLAALPAERIFHALAVGTMGTGHYILEFYGYLCGLASQLPFHSLVLGRPSPARLLIYYVFLAAGSCSFLPSRMSPRSGELSGDRGSRKRERRTGGQGGFRLAAWGRFFLAWGLGMLFLTARPVAGLEVDILDVGQGDGIFIQTSRAKILVDGGSSQVKNLGKARLTPFLKSRGIHRLDTIFVTHGDLDHVSGIRYLLEEGEIRADRLVFSSLSRGDETCRELAELEEMRGGEVWYMEAGQPLVLGDLTLSCLYPSRSDTASNKNDQSLVLLAEYGDFRMLLTGDLEADGERRLLSGPGGARLEPVTVLKAGHHGSGTSTGEELLRRVRPRAAVLSYGEGNRYGHPALEAVERLENAGARLWRTADSGMVSVWTDGKKVKIRGFLE